MEVVDINTNGRTDERCIDCFHKTYQRLFKKFNVGQREQKSFVLFFQATVNANNHLSSPEIQRILNNAFCQIIKVPDPFAEEKKTCNKQATELYGKWRAQIILAVNPFDLAIRLSIAGNIMDYGANNNFDINKTIGAVINAPFDIDHSIALQNAIRQAKKILYLGDNAGEIVFDKLFIETMMHPEITYAVRGASVLNDATMEDAAEVGMDLVADVISNGFDAPSTVLSKCSDEFLDVYNSADLIISKGQGNYEGLMRQKDKRIFFLLMAKCDIISEMLSVEKGSFVVYNQTE